MTSREARRRNAGRVYPEVPPETLALLQNGKLEQVCPACGTREAAGWTCTKCLFQTGPDDWRRAERSAAQKAASSAVGHRRAEIGATKEKTAIPAAVEGQR